MKQYTAIVQRCRETGLYVGYVPQLPGAHTQAETLDELHRNLKEVIELVREGSVEDTDPEFIGTQLIEVG